jgi:hypothetical protein
LPQQWAGTSDKEQPMHDDNRFAFFTEGAGAIARYGEMLKLNDDIERGCHDAVDRAMRAAGFVLVDDDHLARFAVPADCWGAVAYTRNGLVVCRGGEGWCVHVQGTGQLLASLPESVGAVSRFVRQAERMMS